MGHTDGTGAEGYNMTLSRKRVMYVKNYLTRNGVKNTSVLTDYRGESDPVDLANKKVASQKNRRVELYFL